MELARVATGCEPSQRAAEHRPDPSPQWCPRRQRQALRLRPRRRARARATAGPALPTPWAPARQPAPAAQRAPAPRPVEAQAAPPSRPRQAAHRVQMSRCHRSGACYCADSPPTASWWRRRNSRSGWCRDAAAGGSRHCRSSRCAVSRAAGRRTRRPSHDQPERGRPQSRPRAPSATPDRAAYWPSCSSARPGSGPTARCRPARRSSGSPPTRTNRTRRRNARGRRVCTCPRDRRL